MNSTQKTIYEISKMGLINILIMYLPLLMMILDIGGMKGDTSLAAISLNLLNPICVVLTSAVFGRKMGIEKWYFALVIGVIFIPMVMLGQAPLFYVFTYVGISAVCVIVFGIIKRRKERYGETRLK